MIFLFRRRLLLARLPCGGFFAGAVLVPTLHLAFHHDIPHDHDGGGIHIHGQGQNNS